MGLIPLREPVLSATRRISDCPQNVVRSYHMGSKILPHGKHADCGLMVLLLAGDVALPGDPSTVSGPNH